MPRLNLAKARAMGATDEQIARYAKSKGLSIYDPTPAAAPAQEEKKDRGLLDLLSVGTSIAGGIGGGALGTLVATPGAGTAIGAVGGSAAGGALGEWLEQLISGDKRDFGDIGEEAAWGAGGSLLGLGAGRLLGGAGRGIAKEATRMSISKHLPKSMSVGDMDEVLKLAMSKSAPGGSNLGKARGYEAIGEGLKTTRREVVGTATRGIPKTQAIKELKNRALKVGLIDKTKKGDVKELEFLIREYLGKGKSVNPSSFLSLKENLKPMADLANTAIQKGNISGLNAKTRAAYSLQRSADDVLLKYLPDDATRNTVAGLTETMGKNIPLTKAYNAASREGRNLKVPLVGDVPMGIMSRPFEATTDFFTRGAGRLGSSATLAQLLGQGGTAPFRTEGSPTTGTDEVLEGEAMNPMVAGLSDPQQEEPTERQKMGELLETLALMDTLQGNGKNTSRLLALAKVMGGGTDANTAKKLGQLNQAQTIVTEFGKRALALNPSQSAPLARLKGYSSAIGSPIGLITPEVRAFKQNRTGMRVLLARAMGEVGNLSLPEQQAALDMIPDIGDSEEEVILKVQGLVSMLEAMKQQITPEESSSGYENLLQSL